MDFVRMPGPMIRNGCKHGHRRTRNPRSTVPAVDGRAARLGDHRRSQEDRHHVRPDGRGLPGHRRRRGALDAAAASCGRVPGPYRPDTFNQMFTMHGTTMVFFVGMPILIGIANYLVPLMIGARDMAFPRLNALGFWVTLFGGLLVYFSFATGGAPAIGWFAYAPLTEHAFARGPATDFWVLGLLVSGIGTLTGGDQLHRHDPGHALPGHDPAQDSVLRLDDVLDLRADPLRHPAADRRPDHDPARPQAGSPFLRRADGGSAILVAAPVLVLRPSRRSTS